MATIKDVAKRANVSTTTVSHVINKTRFVAEETRNAVWAAIKELHYSPSAVARSLKVNHTKSIGLLATSSEAAYFAEIIEAVEKNCFQKGYTLILGNAWNNIEKQRAYLSMMAQKRVDGLLECVLNTLSRSFPCWKSIATFRWWSWTGAKRAQTLPTPLLITPLKAATWRGVIW